MQQYMPVLSEPYVRASSINRGYILAATPEAPTATKIWRIGRGAVGTGPCGNAIRSGKSRLHPLASSEYAKFQLT
jgi:hypothetical protein